MIKDELLKIARAQHGYFTAQQAKNVGYVPYNHKYYVNYGHWLKIDRGIYRLPGYEDTIEGAFIRWSFWALGRSTQRLAVVSHESAIYYYGLASRLPCEVHLTIQPKGFRVSKDENLNCIFHREDLFPFDYIYKPGYNITTPLRTLIDMKPDLLFESRWLDAVQLAEAKRLIDNNIARELLGEVLYHQMLNTEQSWARPSYSGLSVNVSADGLGDIQRSTAMNDMYGRVRMGRNEHSERQVPNRSFTLIEVLVVVAIMCLLLALLVPALKKTVTAGKTAACANTLFQMGIAHSEYISNNHGFLATGSWGCDGYFNLDSNLCGITWPERLWKYLDNGKQKFSPRTTTFVSYYNPVFNCAEVGHAYLGTNYPAFCVSSYSSAKKLSDCFVPSKKAFMTDSFNIYYNGDGDLVPIEVSGKLTGVTIRHDLFANLLFFDAHVKAYTVPVIPIYGDGVGRLWNITHRYVVNGL